MSVLNIKDNTWNEFINQVDTGEEISGGINGNANIATRQLAENIFYIKTKMYELAQNKNDSLSESQRTEFTNLINDRIDAVRNLISEYKDLTDSEVQQVITMIQDEVNVSLEKIDEAVKDNATKSDELSERIDTEISEAMENFQDAINAIEASDEAVEEIIRTVLGARYQDGKSPLEMTLSLILQEETVRAEKDLAQAKRVDILQSSIGGEYEAFKTWKYYEDPEDWVGGVYNPEEYSLKVLNTELVSPSFSVDGGKFNHVKLRIKRIGEPTWKGKVLWNGRSETEFKDIEEPLDWNDSKFITLNIDLAEEWRQAATINTIYFQLTDDADTNNYFIIDWISIGRNTPGISTAQIATIENTITEIDSAVAERLTSIEADLVIPGSGYGEGSYNEWIASTIGPEGAQTKQLETLNSKWEGAEGFESVVDIINNLETKTTATEARALSNETITAKFGNLTQDDLTPIINSYGEYVDKVDIVAAAEKATAEKLEGLSVEYNESSVDFNDRLTVLADENTASATLVSSLTARTDATEGSISSLEQVIVNDDGTGLAQRMDNLELDIDGEDGISARITSLDKIVSDNNTTTVQRLSDLDLSREGLESSITSLESIVDLENENSVITSRFSSIDSKVGENSGSIDSLERIVDMGNENSVIVTKFNDLNAKTDSAIGSITELEEVVVGPNNSIVTQISNLDGRTAATEGSISELQETTNTLTTSITENNREISSRFNIIEDIEIVPGYSSQPEYYKNRWGDILKRRVFDNEEDLRNYKPDLNGTDLGKSKEIKKASDLGIDTHTGNVYIETSVPSDDVLISEMVVDEDGKIIEPAVYEYRIDNTKNVEQIAYTDTDRVFTRNSVGDNAWSAWFEIIDTSEYEELLKVAKAILYGTASNTNSVISVKEKTYADMETAMSEIVTAIESEVDGNTANIETITKTYATKSYVGGEITSEIDNKFKTVDGVVTGSLALELKKAWSDDFASTSEKLENFVADYNGNIADVIESVKAYADNDSASAEKLDALTAGFGDKNLSTFESEIKLYADELSSSAQKIDSLTSEWDGKTLAEFESSIKTYADEESATAEKLDTLTVGFGDKSLSDFETEIKLYADKDSTSAQKIDSLTSEWDGRTLAEFESSIKTYADEDSASAQKLDALTANFGTKTLAEFESDIKLYADEESASAQKIDSLTSELEGNSSTIEELKETTSTNSGSIATMNSKLTTEYIPKVENIEANINNAVKSTDVEYYLSTSTTEPLGGEWLTTAPPWTPSTYMFQRIKTTYVDDTIVHTPGENGTNISGAKGDKGIDGTSGRGVVSIVEQYAVSTSKKEKDAPTLWTTTMPEWSYGLYIWTRSAITYTDSAIPEYTQPLVDSSWEAVNNLETGGRNLLPENTDNVRDYGAGEWVKPSDMPIVLNEKGRQWVTIYFNHPEIVNGKEYVLSFSMKKISGTVTNIGGHSSPHTTGAITIDGDIVAGSWGGGVPMPNDTEWHRVSVVITSVVKDNFIYIQVDRGQGYTNDSVIEVNGIKLERGNKATDWSPAPEDVTEAIQGSLDIGNAITNEFGKLKGEAKVLTEIDGKISGWKNLNDGTTSSFDILADNFSIGNSTVSKKPFSISGNNITFNGKVSFNSMTDTEVIDKAVDDINNLEIGGRNLIHKGNDVIYGYVNASANAVTAVNGLNSNQDFMTDYIPVKTGDNYVATVYPLVSNPSIGTGIYVHRFTSGKSRIDHVYKDAGKGVKNVLKYTAISDGYIIVVFRGYTEYNHKLEKGVISTDWTPSPEDVKTSVDNITSDNKVTPNEKRELLRIRDEIISTHTELLKSVKTVPGATTPSTYTTAYNMASGVLDQLGMNSPTEITNIRTQDRALISTVLTAYFTERGKLNDILISKSKAYTESQANAAKDAAIEDAMVKDTRNVNEPPSWYYTNYALKTAKEFKNRSTMGITGGTGTYCYVETHVKWKDPSGGNVDQTAYTDDSRIFTRHGSASTWTVWVESESTGGAQKKASDALKDAKSYADTKASNAVKDIIGDNKITPNEKRELLRVKDEIVSTHTELLKSVATVPGASVPSTYTSAYSTITSRLTSAAASPTTISNITTATRTNLTNGLSAYFTQRAKLNDLLVTKAKAYAESQATAAKNHADLKDKVVVIDSRTKKFLSPASFSQRSGSITGYLIIETPITGSRMVKLNITGYNYQDGKTNLELAVGFYITSTLSRYDYADTGTYPIGNVRLGIKNGKAVVIIGNSNSTWSYPKIEVVQAIIGHTNPPDTYKDGWTIRYSTSLSGITDVKVINNNNSTSLKSLQDNVYQPGTTFIDGGNIYTDSIKATSIGVTNLSSINSNLGAITGGSININNRFKVDSAGNMTATSGSFKGNISGATGTFTGSITGASGTFSGLVSGGRINIGNGNFTVDSNGKLYAESGTFKGTVLAEKISGTIDIASMKKSAWMPAWKVYYDPYRIRSSPSSFDRSYSGSLGSQGAIDAYYAGDGNFEMTSVMFEVSVYCVRATVVKQKVVLCDDFAYVWVNGSRVRQFDNGHRGTVIQYSLKQGTNLIQIILTNDYGGATGLVLAGNFIDNVNVKFA